MTISEREQFLFDIQGFLLLEGALSPDEVLGFRSLTRRLEARQYDDAWMANARSTQPPSPTKEGDPLRLRLNGLLRLDPGFDALIDHPRVLPYLERFMDRPQLVNTWSIHKIPDAAPSAWHRGVGPEHYSVRNGQIRTAMLNVVWFLDDNGPEDGCMVVVPGSHKNGIDLDLSRIPHGEMPGARRAIGRAGDVLLMSESVLHDGLRKTSPGSRTNLYCNYTALSFNVMTFSPEHNRHFCMPPAVRARFTPKRREMTRWMEHCAPIEAPLPYEASR